MSFNKLLNDIYFDVDIGYSSIQKHTKMLKQNVIL